MVRRRWNHRSENELRVIVALLLVMSEIMLASASFATPNQHSSTTCKASRLKQESFRWRRTARFMHSEDEETVRDRGHETGRNDVKFPPTTIASRRAILALGGMATSSFLVQSPADATVKKSNYFSLLTKKGGGASALREPVPVSAVKSLSAENCLLRLLPVKNNVFRTLERDLESISMLRQMRQSGTTQSDPDAWSSVSKTSQATLKYLDAKRGKLEPVFNPDVTSTLLEIRKAERGELYIEELRNNIVDLVNATAAQNSTATFEAQKRALMSLSLVGELLVSEYPYAVPTEGKFSFLPRLLGRARVTFTMKRKDKTLGNVTVIADGFAAPITAGEFVDLCARNFYTGLPVKTFKKQLGVKAYACINPNLTPYACMGDDGIVANTLANLPRLGSAFQGGGIRDDNDESETTPITLPVLGSFQEGFYDPLTAKPRRIPLEIVRIDRDDGKAKLSYASGFSSDYASASNEGLENRDEQMTAPMDKPVLSFEIPGLLALNHPDRNLNGGSSEFFVLPKQDISKANAKLMDGQYAPFGYVVDGLDLIQELQADDLISATDVSEYGLLNLVKIRGTSFADVMQSSSEESE